MAPQAGNTGLVGGSIPMHGEAVLSTTRMYRIDEAQRAVAEHDLALGTDLASRESATLGNGLDHRRGRGDGQERQHPFRFARHRSRPGHGRVVTRWTALAKDDIVYDLPGLLAGSEVTLAVITWVLLRLVVPAHATTAAVVVGVDAFAVRVAISAAGLDLVCELQGVRQPLDACTAYAALFEVSGPADPAEPLLGALSGADGIVDATLASGHGRRLWHYRESHTGSAAAASSTPVLKLGIAGPRRAMDSFLDELSSLLHNGFPGVRPICCGHFVDGNVHVNYSTYRQTDAIG